MKRAFPMVAVLATLVFGSTLEAQQASSETGHPGTAAIDAELRLLASESTPAQRARSEVSSFLELDRVEAVAEGIGVDMSELRRKVATLDDDALLDLRSGLPDAQGEALAGGEVITVTSTTIIIALLVLILIIVA